MEVGALSLTLQAIGGNAVTSALGKVRTELQKTGKDGAAFDNAMASLKGTLVNFASGITVGAVLTKIVNETSNAQFAAAQLEATLKSTKMVAGQSADALNAHAEALARMSIYDDDAISGAQSLLLTFTKIRGATFSEATQAVLNVATAMGTDLRSAAIQVGKALNDPILGVAALARSGIQFTDAQKAMIQQLVESNRLMDAQKIILAELETQFGGSAAAARDTFGGAIKGLVNELGNLAEISSDKTGGVVNAINHITDAVRGLNVVLSDISAPLTRFGDMLLRLPRWMTSGMQAPGMPILQLLMGKGAQGVGTAAKAAAPAPFTPATSGPAALGGTAKAAKPGLSPFEEYFRQQGLRPLEGAPKAGANIFGVDPAKIRASAQEIGSLMNAEFQNNVINTALQLGEQLRQTLGAGIASAFETLVTRGATIGDAFGALGATLLRGLGDMLVQFGTSLLPVATLFHGVVNSLRSLNPVAMTAAAIGLIAIGGMMRGAAGRAFGGVGGGSAPVIAGAGLGGAGGPMTLPGLTFGPTAAATGATMAPRSNIAVTVIGPNDPSAQRQIQELIRNADRRGGTTTV